MKRTKYILVIFMTIYPLSSFAKNQDCDFLAKIVMEGVRKNQITVQQLLNAKEICTKQALEGNPEAQYHLGGLNTVYIGDIYPNESEMWKWINLSAKNGYAKAQGFLGRSYETENNVSGKKDITLAIKWHTLAAEQHDIASIVRLEEIYRKGLLGVEVDLEKAKYWANKLGGFRVAP